jgi:anti-sigma factor RsiW
MSMAPSGGEALRVRLSALLDGQSPAGEQQDLEARLRDDPQARQMREHLLNGSARGREVFDDLLKEPVPLDLVRTIKTASPPRKAVRLPSERPSLLSLKPTMTQAAITCLLVFILGSSLGYMLGQPPAAPAQLRAADTRSGDWLDDIVSHYRVFSSATDRLVELPASGEAAIVEWLLVNTGVNFRIPNLSDSGLTFEGARLFVAGGAPVGHLIYTSVEGEVIGILFRKNHPDDDGFSELIRDNIALMSWKSPTTTYVVVGPSSAASLGEIAAKAAGLI